LNHRKQKGIKIMNETISNHNPFQGESPSNYEPKKPILISCDVSGSMDGDSIDQVNQGLAKLQSECENNPKAAASVELCIESFGSQARCVQEFALIQDADIPILDANEDKTDIVSGIKTAIMNLKARFAWYRETNQLTAGRGLLIVLTDGQPNPPQQDFKGAAKMIADGYENGEFLTLLVGIPGCDLAVLQQMAHPKLPPIYLDTLSLEQFFGRLSQSVSAGDHRNDDLLIQILTGK
jgi:uncharacterized protein YegL